MLIKAFEGLVGFTRAHSGVKTTEKVQQGHCEESHLI